MATVKDHYDSVLSDVYSWMLGGFAKGIEKNIEFFDRLKIKPSGSRVAIDLGAGCGFQSIPLAKLGYSVTAIDLDAKLLAELKSHSAGLPIKTVQDDMLNFDEDGISGAELIVCMTDTIVHLESSDQVILLLSKAYQALESNGKLLLTFRDLSNELRDLDRFIPVRSDDNRIFTCFLEYERDFVKVHDIVYSKDNGEWKLAKSFYKKLRISADWITRHLDEIGFSSVETSSQNGLITIVASK